MTAIPALFRDLLQLAAPTEGKPDPHENLTDILEIVSVAKGLRPAHLQGQGLHDEMRVTTLDQVARKHGLRTMRTKALVPHFHRPRQFDQPIIDVEDAELRRGQLGSPDVLWVYVDEAVEGAIPGVVAGETAVSTVLGYPDCCVVHNSEQKIVLSEAYAAGILRAYPGSTPAEVAEMWQRSVSVPIAVDPNADLPQTEASLRRFPYVQFIACPTCVTGVGSPGDVANALARNLAFEIDPRFGKSIWQTRDLAVNRGKSISIGRNDQCPCGRGAKFKKCCGP